MSGSQTISAQADFYRPLARKQVPAVISACNSFGSVTQTELARRAGAKQTAKAKELAAGDKGADISDEDQADQPGNPTRKSLGDKNCSHNGIVVQTASKAPVRAENVSTCLLPPPLSGVRSTKLHRGCKRSKSS